MTTRDEVIKAAREADCAIHDVEELERLYALAFNAGMERAAEICDRFGNRDMHPHECRDAIREEAKK